MVGIGACRGRWVCGVQLFAFLKPARAGGVLHGEVHTIRCGSSAEWFFFVIYTAGIRMQLTAESGKADHCRGRASYAYPYIMSVTPHDVSPVRISEFGPMYCTFVQFPFTLLSGHIGVAKS